MATADSAQDPKSVVVPAVILMLATWLAYSNCLNAPFIFDDISNIEANEAIRSLWPLGSVVDKSNRPLLMLTLAFNYAIGGLDVRGYHLFDVVVHIVAGLTLFAFVRRTLRLRGVESRFRKSADLIAFSIALIWLVHPLQTQAVTYIVQRCESLMGMFFLLFLYCTLRGALSPKPIGWYLSAVTFCWLGMGTKEVMVVAPIVMLVYDRIFLSDSWKAVCRNRWPVYLTCGLAQVALLVLVPKNLAQHADVSAGFQVRGLTAWEYVRSQPAVILHYLRLAFWPDQLCLDYMWPVARSPLEIYGAGLVILALLAGSLQALRWRPRLALAGMAFFVVLAPTSSFMPILDLAVEHRMYLPLISVIVLAVLCLFVLVSRLLRAETSQRSAFVTIVLIAAAALTVRTRTRNADYFSRTSMWSDVVAKAPHNFRGHLGLGLALQGENKFDQAVAAFERAIELNPSYAMAHHSLGVLQVAQGRADEAISHYEQAIRFSAGYVLAYRNYGNLLARQGDYHGAMELYTKAAAVQPPNEATYRVIAHTLLRVRRYKEAADALQAAVNLKPDSLVDVAWLAWVRATAPDAELRDGEEAVRLANQAVRATRYQDSGAMTILAAAYAEAGRFDEAIRTARQTLGLARAAGDEEFTKKARNRLSLLQQQRPIHQTADAFVDP